MIEDPDRLGEGIGEFHSLHPHACVSFYAIDEETGEVSAPTSITVDAPLPSETLTVGQPNLYPNSYPMWEVTVTGCGERSQGRVGL